MVEEGSLDALYRWADDVDAIAAQILRARTASETGATFEINGLREEIAGHVTDCSRAIAAADMRTKALADALAREPEAHPAQLAALMPSYCEDIADFLNLGAVF